MAHLEELSDRFDVSGLRVEIAHAPNVASTEIVFNRGAMVQVAITERHRRDHEA